MEVEDLLSGLYPELLTKRFNPQGSRVFWSSRNPLGAADWLLSSCVLLVGPNFSGVQYTHLPRMPVSTQLYVPSAARGWFGINVWPSVQDWLPKTRESSKGRKPFTFAISPYWEQLHSEKTVHRTSSVNNIWYVQSFRSISGGIQSA